MHLRRLIVLIIYARNIINTNRSCNSQCLHHRADVFPKHHCFGLIGQIKKTRIHVAKLCLSEGVGSNGTVRNLFTISKYRVVDAEASKHNQTFFALRDVMCNLVGISDHRTYQFISVQKDQKIGGARRDRTDDILLAKQALSQLSYGPSVTLSDRENSMTKSQKNGGPG